MATCNTMLLQIRISQHNDEVAFKELYYVHYKELYRFAITFLHKRELAEEVMQDVFTKIWINRKGLHNIQNLRVYLFKSVKNKCLDYLEKEKLLNHFELDEVKTNIGHLSRTPEDILVSAEILEHINEILQTLPPKCKMIFQLVKEENLKYKEVAEILDISLKTVENQVGIALKKISHGINLHQKGY